MATGMSLSGSATIFMSDSAHEIIGDLRPGRWLVTCDHASNAVPGWIGGGTLGLPPEEMARHIAWSSTPTGARMIRPSSCAFMTAR